MEGEPQSLGEKHSSWSEEGKAEPHRPSVPQPSAPQPETLCMGWALKLELQRSFLEKRLGLAMQKQPEAGREQ